MTDQTTVVDQFAGSLAVFDPLKAEIAKYKEKNANMVFPYETSKGEADARSWCFKLRRLKGPLTEIHKIAKAKALAHCQAVDAEKNHCFSEVDEMVKVHMDPINRKIKQQEEAEATAAEKLRLAKEAEEAARIKELEQREAKVKAEEERLVKVEAERKSKVIADTQVATERQAKVNEANEKIRQHEATKIKVKEDALAADRARFDAEKRAEAEARLRARQATESAAAHVKADVERKEAERLAAVKAEKDEKKRLDEEEAKRVADAEHRYNVKTCVVKQLTEALGEQFTAAQLIDFIEDEADYVPQLKIIY